MKSICSISGYAFFFYIGSLLSELTTLLIVDGINVSEIGMYHIVISGLHTFFMLFVIFISAFFPIPMILVGISIYVFIKYPNNITVNSATGMIVSVITYFIYFIFVQVA
jgi:hypothetical protein